MENRKMNKVLVKGEGIRLGQFLKIANLVSTGGEAKVRIQGGEVSVNDMREKRRGLQLKNGDCIEFEDEFYEVILEEANRK